VNTIYDPVDRLVLAHVPKERVRERDAYEFLVRLEPNGDVIWSRHIPDRGAVVPIPAQFVALTSLSSNAQTILVSMTGPSSEGRFEGGLGIYDAPEPWRPATTVFYTDAWDVGSGDSASFPSKWIFGV
jgi:hypothetical protein